MARNEIERRRVSNRPYLTLRLVPQLCSSVEAKLLQASLASRYKPD